MRRVPASDDEAFEAFVRQHASTLLRAAVLLSGSRDRGEDLLQDTLTHLYPRWDRVVATDQPVAYVRRALVNRFLSEQRTPRRRAVMVSELPERPAGVDLDSTIAERDAVWRLLSELAQRPRAAVVLRYFYDLPDADIAEMLGCRVATVRSVISRAMVTMRHSLAPDTPSRAGT